MFFFRAPKSLTALNTCLDEMEEFKGKHIAFVSDWLAKKVFKTCLQRFWLLNLSLSYYRVNTIWYVFPHPFHCESSVF